MCMLYGSYVNYRSRQLTEHYLPKRNNIPACRQRINNNRTVEKLTEEEIEESNESISESDESIHQIEEIKTSYRK